MVAPYPYEGVVKRIALSQRANEIYGHYVWLARWSDEIGRDAELDLKKLAQLAFVHCRIFSALLTNPPAGLMRAVARRLEAEGIGWATAAAMQSDLTALRDEAASLFAFVRDNVPQARNFATRTYDAGGGEVEQVAKIAKDPAIATEVAKVRALFS